jgi:hypothetical protein
MAQNLKLPLQVADNLKAIVKSRHFFFIHFIQTLIYTQWEIYSIQ